MSLVAYEVSSDEESNSSNEEKLNSNISNIEIIKSDLELESQPTKKDSIALLLEKKLPPPISKNQSFIKEEDDEFLKRKSTISAKQVKEPVKITIPCLSNFKDLEGDEGKLNAQSLPKSKNCGLLSILPKPKDEYFKKSKSPNATSQPIKSIHEIKLIPDSVRNTSKVTKIHYNVVNKPERQDVNNDEAENDNGDYFSLNSTEDKLPEVNINEINVMIAEKAAKIMRINAPTSVSDQSEVNQPSTPLFNENNEEEQINIDKKAIHILAGSHAKRRKVEKVNIVELSSDEVLPNKDEWLRAALTTATTYQPKGVLLDDEVAPGTRKKHQITYLAHQAKANELELQAMWSANRHTRRQTQSKYGF